jgi:hypothetical protein
VDESTYGQALTSTDGTSTTTLEPGSSSGGDVTTGDATTGDTGDASTTGSAANPYEGSYDGEWDGNCSVVGDVAGTMTFAVASDGMLTGSLIGSYRGSLAGTVDDAGMIDSVATSMIAGMCPFEGQIDGAGNASGPWSCALGCEGTWSAQVN